jgi:Fe-S-cluster-containing dehydrogenase component
MGKKYWKSIDESEGSPGKDYIEDHQYVNKNELSDLAGDKSLQTQSSRRDFLKLCGFSIATSALIAGCERPVQKAIPYLFKPEEVTPGEASYYASTFFNGDDYGSILVKVRDGRPIKIEGNDLSDLSAGTASARIQASVLELYDSARYRQPFEDGRKVTWEYADSKVREALSNARTGDGKTVLLTGTVISPSTEAVIADFLLQHPGSEWIQYDPVSFSAMLEANRLCFNSRVIPAMHFDKADLVVSFGADFLGTWLMPGIFAGRYSRRRQVSEEKPDMSRHIQFENNLSITGAAADQRIPVKPSRVKEILYYLHQKLIGNSPAAVPNLDQLDQIVSEMKENAGRSLIVCGYNDLDAQVLTNAINHFLGNYGSTLDFTEPVNLRKGSDSAMQVLTDEMNRGEVAAILIHNVNPLFDYPDSKRFRKGLENVGLKISLAGAGDETSALCDFICPDHHYLESWGDARPSGNCYSLQQPVIRPLGNTRQMQESLLAWSGAEPDYHTYIKEFWENRIFAFAETGKSFPDFWDECLQKGVLSLPSSPEPQPSFDPAHLPLIAESLTDPVPGNGLELEIIQSIAIGSGKQANNPWLQELPDPLSKVSWDNYLAVSPSDAEELSLSTGDIVIVAGDIRLPVLVQPGQAQGAVSASMGYGRTIAGKVAEGVGANVLPLAGMANGLVNYCINIGLPEKTGEKHKMALSQTHHSMEGRAIVRETTLDEYKKDPTSGNEMRKKILDHMYTLYDEVKFDGLHWAMAIDLNACTGCSSCVIACQAENNIPVIGKEEVYRRRIMHWIRIDRYYSGEAGNPGVHFMPVMCQHCDNAPCENVCPVAATNHSDEGINQMAYVRCIGTKYCINNCPYKVRRFNWFNYTRSDDYNSYMNDDTGRMVLNPDVTVRERGIVEKCSFCIQRIQEAKIKAKAENRVLRENEVLPACVQTCPSQAIVFGNIADKNSRVAKLFSDKRNYHLLEELHTLPSVGYLTKVKNKQS